MPGKKSVTKRVYDTVMGKKRKPKAKSKAKSVLKQAGGKKRNTPKRYSKA